MIKIQKSETADTRTCDFANVSHQTLLESSVRHIDDVRRALEFFGTTLNTASRTHDTDKITDIDGFHADFVTGFKQDSWWTRHRQLNRHHLTMADGVRDDVNLIDVLDFIADCVMAGMARSGSVYALNLPPELLERAFQNTAQSDPSVGDLVRRLQESQARLTEIQARYEKATKGPWVYERLSIHERARRQDGPTDSHHVVDADVAGKGAMEYTGREVCGLACTRGKYEREEANGIFIAHAREDIPFLLKLLREAADALLTKERV